jgi:hypothetical protein
MQTCNPLEARKWFRLREPMNRFVAIIGFIFISAALWVPFKGFFAMCVAAILMYFFYKLVLRNRQFAIQCPNCKKIVQTNTPWVCGSCYWKNLHANEYPFIHRCEHYDCGAEPKAYLCHHCNEPIFLTEDRQIAGCAISVGSLNDVSHEMPDADEHELAILKKKWEIELKELAIKEASLDVQLKGLRQSPELPKKKSIEDSYRQLVKNDDDARKLRAQIDEEFKDDPDERKRRHRYVDDILRETL